MDVFNEFDVDKNGHITREKLLVVMQQLGQTRQTSRAKNPQTRRGTQGDDPRGR